MFQPTIRKRILEKIGQYCQGAGISVEEYINTTLDDAINLAIYGDINEKIKPMEQVVATKTEIAERPTVGVAEKAEKKEKKTRATWTPDLAQKLTEEDKPAAVVELEKQVVETTKSRKRVRTIASK